MYRPVVDQPYHGQDAGKGLSLPYDLANVCNLAIEDYKGYRYLRYETIDTNNCQLNAFIGYNTSIPCQSMPKAYGTSTFRDPKDTDQVHTRTIQYYFLPIVPYSGGVWLMLIVSYCSILFLWILLDSPVPGSNKSETQLAISEYTATISTLLSKGKTVDLFPLIFSCPGIGGEAGEDRTIYVNRCVPSLFTLWRIDRLSGGVVGGLVGLLNWESVR